MNRITSACLGLTAFTTLILVGHGADAFSRRLHASACFVEGASGATAFNGNAVFNYSASSGATVFCSLPDDTYLPKERVSSITFAGNDGHDKLPVLVGACLVNFDGTGASCDAATTSGAGTFTGAYALSPDHHCWQSGHHRDFAFVEIALPPAPSTELPSSLRGFHISDR